MSGTLRQDDVAMKSSVKPFWLSMWVQCSTAFDQPSDASTVSKRCASILERCDSCGSIN
jgi:hypothetical protein